MDIKAYKEATDMKSKTEIRKEFRQKRRRLTANDVSSLSEKIAERLIASEDFKRAKTVMLYKSVDNEVSLEGVLDSPLAENKIFAFPVCVSKTEIKAYIPKEWRKGAFGIIEPDPSVSIEVPPEDIDLIILPGVAFCEDGRRLGMGGGYYDRFLPKCKNARTVMIAFECQKADELPCDGFDKKVDMVLTEKAVY